MRAKKSKKDRQAMANQESLMTSKQDDTVLAKSPAIISDPKNASVLTESEINAEMMVDKL